MLMHHHYRAAVAALACLFVPSLSYGITFQDRTASLMPTGYSVGQRVAMGDLNNDGLTDLVTNEKIFLNNGNSFSYLRDVSYDSSVLGDVNNDGWLDIYNHEFWSALYYNNGGTSFTRKTTAVLPSATNSYQCVGSAMLDVNNDGYLDFFCGGYETGVSSTYPDGVFPDTIVAYNPTSQKYEVAWTETPSFQRSPSDILKKRRTRGITAADFDRDGDQDIYTSTYRLDPNCLWVNNAPANDSDYSRYADCGSYGSFGEGAAAYGADGRETFFYNCDQSGVNPDSTYYGHTIGSAWGDIDNDGYLDLFVGNFRHNRAYGDDVDGDGDVDVQRYYQDYAHFLRNTGPDGDYHFERKAQLDGADWQESYASPTLGDYDNDGDLDLLFTTVYDNDHSRLYRNDGNWQFTDVTDSMGLDRMTHTYLAAWGDIDNDGDLDLVTGDKIYINDASTNGNHWVKIKLDGDGETVNRSAIGSQVRIYLDDKILTRQVEGGTGQGNQNDLTLHFGLGDYDGPIDVEIFWSDGTIQTLDNMEIDGLLSLSKSNVPGDANLDGRVDGSDVTILAAYWQHGIGMAEPDATWKMGDFNGDGIVDGSDVTILASNWQEGITAAATAVPEPSMLGLLGMLAALGGLVRVRR